VRPAAKHEREFLERADEELEKVNSFYAAQEAELLARGEALIDQLRILADVKRILADHAASRRARGLLGRSRSMPATTAPQLSGSGRYLLSGLASPQSMSGRCAHTRTRPFPFRSYPQRLDHVTSSNQPTSRLSTHEPHCLAVAADHPLRMDDRSHARGT
jgi:hypothetical protein